MNNSAGIAGVSYASTNIMPVQVLQADGTGYDSDVIAGVIWAADNGANVILMGFSSPDYSAALADAIAYASGNGVVLVAATGNDGSTAPSYPAGMANVIGVAATDENDNLASGSNTGSAFVAAPGVNIYTTLTGGSYGNVGGTSAASAHVAGLAALLAANGNSNNYIYNQILGATDPIGQSFGRINVTKALGGAVTPGATPVVTATPTPVPSPTYDVTGVTPFITLTPNSGLLGTNVNVGGEHFHNGDTITIKFNNVAQATSPSSCTVSGNTFTCSFTVPVISPSSYQVTANDTNSNTASATFTVPSPPNITSFAPTSSVSDIVGATRRFNITVNQTVNVTWYINGTPVLTNTSVINANYTNTSAAVGFWNITAIANNTNGTASQKWNWTVNNVAPVVDAGADATINEGDMFSSSGNFTDPGADTWTATVNYGDGSGVQALTLSEKNFSLSHLYADNGTYTVTVTVTDDDSGMGSDTAVVTVNNVAPTVSNNLPTQTTQYSDPIINVTISATDIAADIPLSASTSWKKVGDPAFTTVPSLPTDLILTSNGCISNTCTWNLSGRVFVAPANYTIRINVTDDDGGSNHTDVFINVTKEDARATYTGATFASTSSTTSSSATVTLAATIQDITAIDSISDPNAGNISKANVTFVNRDSGAALCSNLPVGLVNPADIKTGTATCNWAASISGDSQSFTVGIIVNNYYTRNASADDTVVTVSKPLLNNFITGGGYLVLSSSGGQKAGDPDTKNNFGFNVKYNKQGTNLQGSINTIVRRTESDDTLHVYQIKGNSMTSLAVKTSSFGGNATFNGKASIQDITNPLIPISVDGNAALQVTMTDNGEPGSNDTIGITVWNKAGGLWFASNWTGTKTVEQLLGGGNLVVH